MKTAVWLDLLNSDWHDQLGSGRREDRLDNRRWLEEFISRWDLDLRGVPRPRVVRAFRKLRDTLRPIVDRSVAGKEIRRADWSGLNSYLERVPFVRRVLVSGSKAEVVEVPAAGKLAAQLAALAGSFAETLASGDVSRLKVCQNKDCRWVYMDASRNRSRRWCETSCGNLMKVRRYRERQRRRLGKASNFGK
jgi:predicted RNA-binding Zn ribbon-like protein